MTTMKDVAKRAGVSVGTVSRYINQRRQCIVAIKPTWFCRPARVYPR
ncbi:LacI family DNA-binding transcriptional regulator [Ligilactobacillus sp. WC1T17]